MVPVAFATSQPLDVAALDGAPVRWPRPSRLATPLRFENQRAGRAAASLGLTTVGELLEHLPRDHRDARTIDQLAPGEVATVIGEVLRIAARPVRRRGMRPLVEATLGDGSGTLVATFFNQPWLVGRYPPGTRLVLHGKFEARNRFRVQAHAKTSATGSPDGTPAGGEIAEVGHYAATEGLSSTQILALVREHAEAVRDVPEPLPAFVRAAERLPDRAGAIAAAHLGDGDEQALARRRLAFDELLGLQLALLRRRRIRRDGAAAPALNGEPSQT
ncbi:MAG: ATP-dependent DNA helicase RecG, partial [Solirubrobacteraceae bacterium]